MQTLNLPQPVGFVLGGGGSLGAVQVGMLQALAERGVFPDLVVGTSVGSINGAALAVDPEGAVKQLTLNWPRIKRKMVYPGGPLAQLKTLKQGRTHVFPNTSLESLLTNLFPENATFAKLALPFGAVTTDVATASAHVVTAGPLVPALLASSAFPGIYPAVRIEGRLLYDGGVVSNVPVTQALAMGARSLVVLDTIFAGHLPEEPSTLAEAVLYAALISARTQAAREAPLAAALVPVVYLPGPAIQRVSPLEFDQTSMLIDGGYQAAKPFLEGLDITGPGLYGRPSG